MGNKNDSANLTQILDLLNRTLELEYSLIVHYPRIATSIQDEEIKKLAQQLGIASVAHADTVASAITKMGGTPYWSFGLFPEDDDLVEIFETQLEKEKEALQLHQRVAGLINESSFTGRFGDLAKEEESHIKTVEKILSSLRK